MPIWTITSRDLLLVVSKIKWVNQWLIRSTGYMVLTFEKGYKDPNCWSLWTAHSDFECNIGTHREASRGNQRLTIITGQEHVASVRTPCTKPSALQSDRNVWCVSLENEIKYNRSTPKKITSTFTIVES